MSRIRAVGTDLDIPARDGETILAALYRAGYAFRIGCRRGGCGICKVDLRSGHVDYTVAVCDQVLTPQERDSGVALACRAVPTDDVVIAVPPEGRLRCIAPLLAEIACQRYTGPSPASTVSPVPGSALNSRPPAYTAREANPARERE